jgi:hypothetical protein
VDFLDRFKKRAGCSILQAAGIASHNIFRASVHCAEFVRKVAEGETDKRTKFDTEINFKVISEGLCYHYHCTDRIAWENLDEGKRSDFMDAVAYVTAQASTEIIAEIMFHRGDGTALEELKTVLMDDLYRANLEYGSYPWVDADNVGKMKGTVVWEFGKKVAQMVERQDDVSFIIPFAASAIMTMRALQIRDILMELR